MLRILDQRAPIEISDKSIIVSKIYWLVRSFDRGSSDREFCYFITENCELIVCQETGQETLEEPKNYHVLLEELQTESNLKIYEKIFSYEQSSD